MATFSIVTTDNKKYCSALTGIGYNNNSDILTFYNAQGEATNFSLNSNIKSVELGFHLQNNNFFYIQLYNYGSSVEYYDTSNYQREQHSNLNTVYDLIHRYYKYN